MHKKASGRTLFPLEKAIPEALCFGWIDSLPRKIDQERTMLRFTPRKSGTGWSKVNKTHFEAFPRSAKRGILEWITQAKTHETRRKRVAETVGKAARNERANQWTRKTTTADIKNQMEE